MSLRKDVTLDSQQKHKMNNTNLKRASVFHVGEGLIEMKIAFLCHA